MKKFFILVILFSCFLYGCSFFGNEHTHTYDSEWSYNDEFHYYQATCGHDVRMSEMKHSFIEEILQPATHSKEGEVLYTCSECDYMFIKTLEMISHNFSDEYKYNRTKHYYICECGEKKDVEEHDYKEGEVVIQETPLTDGLKIYTCKCGSKKEEIIKAKNFVIDTNKESIYLITTSAGEDISNSVGISWHCNSSGSYLIYQKEGSSDFFEVKPTEEFWSIEESYIVDAYQNKRYVCTVDLKNLDPNTKYIYRIVSGEISSSNLTFKTADSKTSEYSFLSFVDFQYSENSKTLNLVKKFVEENPNANLITCSGDITDEGNKEKSHRYLFDSPVFSNSILGFGVGDHEYWGSDNSPIKMFKKPYSYNKLFNNPDNGCEDYLNTSYYFKYNTSLFVFIDCGDSNVSSSNEMFSKQANWLDNILSKEDYEFIIVCMHKSLYGDPKQDTAVRKFAKVFTEVFDKYKVDLVISGHDHEYSRTKPIYNGVDSVEGTVYLDLGNSGSKTRATGDDIKSSNLYDKYIDIKENNYSLGIIGTIIDGKLIVDVRNQNYQTVDFLEITKKQR